MVVALDQHDIGPQASCRYCGRRPGRASTNHENVGFGENRNVAGGLVMGPIGTGTSGLPFAPVEEFDALLFADCVGEVIAAHVRFSWLA